MRVKQLLAVPLLAVCLTACGENPPTLQHIDISIKMNGGSVPVEARLSGSFDVHGEVVFEESTNQTALKTPGIVSGAVFVDGAASYESFLVFTYDEEALKKAEIPEDALEVVFCDRNGENQTTLTIETRDTETNQLRVAYHDRGNYILVDGRAAQNETKDQ